jgi:hypothetical protein
MSGSKLLREKKQINSGLWVIECPKCKTHVSTAEDYGSLPCFVVCKNCYSTKLLNNVIRMDYRRRFCTLGSKDSL